VLRGYARRVLREWPPDQVLVTPTLTRPPIELRALTAHAGVTDDALRLSALARV